MIFWAATAKLNTSAQMCSYEDPAGSDFTIFRYIGTLDHPGLDQLVL